MTNKQPKTQHEQQQPSKGHYEPSYGHFWEAEEQKKSRYQKAKEYFRDWHNKVSVLTLLFVAAYTVLTYCALRNSNDQITISRDTEDRQLRPYLYAVPGRFNLIMKGNTLVFALNPEVNMFGQTPAGGVNPLWELKLADYPMTSSFIFSYLTNTTATAIVAPNQPYPIGEKTLPLSKDDIDALNGGHKRIYADGTVLYIDSFGKEGRWTNFCFTTNLERIKDEKSAFDACPLHNNADWNHITPQSPVFGNVKM